MKYSKEWLSKSEIDTLFNFEQIPVRDLLIMKSLYYGCFRVNEVVKLKREYLINESDNTYILLPEQKTDKKNWEKQPIPKFLYADLIRYCNDNGIKTQDNIFQSRMKKYKSITRQEIYNICRKWTRLAGIRKPITTHSFRRSRITHLIESDEIGDHEVIIISRHKNYNMLIPYKKLAKKRIQIKLEKVDNE